MFDAIPAFLCRMSVVCRSKHIRHVSLQLRNFILDNVPIRVASIQFRQLRKHRINFWFIHGPSLCAAKIALNALRVPRNVFSVQVVSPKGMATFAHLASNFLVYLRN